MTQPNAGPPRDDAPPPDGLEASQATALAPFAPSMSAVVETASATLAARERASVEARYLVAMQRPRDFDTARLRILKACRRPRFAEAARYAKPIGREKVHGLSIRFAEEIRVLWGNLDVTAYLVFDDEKRRIYRVIGTDLETNAADSVDVMVEKHVERRFAKQGQEVIAQRLNSNGQVVYIIAATEDEVHVKANNMVAKARRNVILTLIPADIKEEAEDECIKTVATRDAKDPEAARKAILDSFFQLGVMPQQVSELLAKPLEQINPAELTLLRTIYTAMKEGETTWAEAVETFGPGGKAPMNGGNGGGIKPKSGVDALKQRVQKQEPAPQAPTTREPGEEADDDLTDQDIAQLDADREKKGGKTP